MRKPTFDDGCMYLSPDDKDEVWDALSAALAKAKRAKTPWSNERRIKVGRLIHLMKQLASPILLEREEEQ